MRTATPLTTSPRSPHASTTSLLLTTRNQRLSLKHTRATRTRPRTTMTSRSRPTMAACPPDGTIQMMTTRRMLMKRRLTRRQRTTHFSPNPHRWVKAASASTHFEEERIPFPDYTNSHAIISHLYCGPSGCMPSPAQADSAHTAACC